MKGDAFELLDHDPGAPRDAETVAEAGLRELYEKQREIDMLARVAGSANASSSTAEAALSLLEAVCDFGPFDCGLALVPADAVSGDGHAIVGHDAVFGRHHEFLHQVQWTFDHQPSSIAELVAEVDEVGFYRTLVDAPPRSLPTEAAANGLSGVCLIPVFGATGVVAVLAFFSHLPIPKDHRVSGLAMGVAAQFGHVIERSRSRMALQRVREQLESRVLERTASLEQNLTLLQDSLEEKRRNKDALVASEHRYRQVVDNLQEVVFQTDAEGRWAFLNPAWRLVTGFTVEESLGRLFIDFVEPEDRARTLDLLQPLAERRVDFCRCEVRYRRKEGGFRWIEVFTRLATGADGQVTGTMGSLTDITEKKLAGEIRRMGDERLRRLTASVPALIYQFGVSADGSIAFRFASEGSRAVFGIEPDALTLSPASLTGRIHPDDLAGFEESIRRHTVELVHWTWTGRYLHPDGTTRWLRGWAQPERAVDGGGVWNGMFVDATDEHAAVAELRQSREQYELAVDGSSCGIWDWDLTANRIYFSPRWKEMLGYRDEELVNSPDTFRELVHSEDLPRVMAALERCMQGETKSYEVEFRMWSRDASYRWILARGAALHDAAGRPFRLAGSHTDITSVKRVEERLRILESAIFHANDSVVITEADSINLPGPAIIYVNEAFCRQTGYRPDEVVGRSPRILQGPRTDRGELDRLRRSLEACRPCSAELVNYRKDGSEYWVEFSVVPIADKSGVYTHWVSVQHDITERKKADSVQQALSRLGLSLSSATSAAEAAGILADESGRVFGWDSFRLLLHDKTTGLVAEVVGIGTEEGRPTVLPNAEPRPASGLARKVITEGPQIILRDGDQDPGLELRQFGSAMPGDSLLLVPVRRGAEAFGLVSVQSGRPQAYTPQDLVTLQIMADYVAAALERIQAQEGIRLANESLEHRVAERTEQLAAANSRMSVEITERRRIETELERERASLAVQVDERTRSLSDANRQLGKAAKHKDEFLASMSHELRTPLNAVLGLSEAMIDEVYGPVTERQRHSLTNISESGRHLLSLINDILDLSKIEAGKMKLEPGLVEIQPLVETSIRFVKEAAQKKKIRIRHELAPDVETLVADERRMKQMLINLLSNAVKFTPESGSICVATRLAGDGNSVEFSVADTGIGIAPEDLAKLFQSFVQVDSSLSREYSGTGLGLALVRKMAEMHGGTVGVASTPGEGSRFSFTLPLDPTWLANDEDVSTPATVPTHIVRRNGSGNTPPAPGARRALQVLIAEDNEMNVLTIRDYLIKNGFTLTVAPNGAEALRLAREIRPDIILMDVQMPVMDGVEATRKIRSDRDLSRIPVIMLTALAMAGDRERCLDAGADEYVAKPFSLRGLVETMHRQLRANGVEIPGPTPV